MGVLELGLDSGGFGSQSDACPVAAQPSRNENPGEKPRTVHLSRAVKSRHATRGPHVGSGSHIGVVPGVVPGVGSGPVEAARPSDDLSGVLGSGVLGAVDAGEQVSDVSQRVSAKMAQATSRLAAAVVLIAEANTLLDHAAKATAGERSRIFTSVQQLKTHLSLVESTAIYAEQTAGTWAASSDKDLASHLGRITREGTREGRQSVARSVTLHKLPLVAQGLETGALTTAHIDVVAKALLNAPDEVAKELAAPDVQAALVRDAKVLAPWQLRKVMNQIVASLNPQAVEDAHQAQIASRFFHVTDTADGTFLKGFVDRASGQRLKLALEVHMHRPTKDDVDGSGEPLTSEQRYADALIGIADNTLNDPHRKTGALLRPHVSVVIQESTWKALRSANPVPGATRNDAERIENPGGAAGSRGVGCSRGVGGAGSAAGSAGSAGRAADPVVSELQHPSPGSALDVATRIVGQIPVMDDSGRVVPPAEVGRILCDCALTRMVVDSESELIDLGKTSRLYANTQRRAVYARDEGCSWQGCEMPVHWCEVHHIEWWSRGGETSVENGIALCSFHHGQVHSRNLTITRYRRDKLSLDGLRFEKLYAVGDDHELPRHDSPDFELSDCELSDHEPPDSETNEKPPEKADGSTKERQRASEQEVRIESKPTVQGRTLPGSARPPTLSGVGYIMTDPTGRVISHT